MAAIIVNLECMTNMHVGNGDVNYNIIDNEVEKDPVTGYPTINASGVKGALREFFNGDSELRQYVSTLFGADKAGDTTPGQLKVLCIRRSRGRNRSHSRIRIRSHSRNPRGCLLWALRARR